MQSSCLLIIGGYIQSKKCEGGGGKRKELKKKVDRLAPDYKYPAALEDVVNAYEYLYHVLDVDRPK